MIHMSADYLRDNHVETDWDPMFLPRETAQQPGEIKAIITVNDQFWDAFETKDGNRWYIVTVKHDPVDKRHPYYVSMFGYDDGILIKYLKTVDEFYQWIQQYEFRDFTYNDVRQYIDEVF